MWTPRSPAEGEGDIQEPLSWRCARLRVEARPAPSYAAGPLRRPVLHAAPPVPWNLFPLLVGLKHSDSRSSLPSSQDLLSQALLRPGTAPFSLCAARRAILWLLEARAQVRLPAASPPPTPGGSRRPTMAPGAPRMSVRRMDVRQHLARGVRLFDSVPVTVCRPWLH